jgi:hypothetical protein
MIVQTGRPRELYVCLVPYKKAPAQANSSILLPTRIDCAGIMIGYETDAAV